jgi:hypothetical protein
MNSLDDLAWGVFWLWVALPLMAAQCCCGWL